MVKTFSLFLLLATACAAVPKPEAMAPGECVDLIHLEGSIDDASQFKADLEACHGRPVVVEINSPGGSVFDALEMQKAIERHGAPVICVVDGMAASAAFVTLQSCTTRAMTNRSILMAHHASLGGVSGQSQDMENARAVLVAIDKALVAFCAKRMGMPLADFEARVSGGKEWWMAFDDALSSRAIDFEMTVAEALDLIHSK